MERLLLPSPSILTGQGPPAAVGVLGSSALAILSADSHGVFKTILKISGGALFHRLVAFGLIIIYSCSLRVRVSFWFLHSFGFGEPQADVGSVSSLLTPPRAQSTTRSPIINSLWFFCS